MDREMVVTGAIIDSWVEPAGLPGDGSRLVLQVAPSGRPKDLMIVEAEASLVGDRGWLARPGREPLPRQPGRGGRPPEPLRLLHGHPAPTGPLTVRRAGPGRPAPPKSRHPLDRVSQPPKNS